MRTVENYRADMLTILGDAGGRRYSESMLDMGLREALRQYQAYQPRREITRAPVLEVDNQSLILSPLDEGVSVLTARDENAQWLIFSEYRTETKLYLNCFGMSWLPSVGSLLTLEVSCPHLIKGLDKADTTTVPDLYALTVCTGAAGYAMRIRARSVTEVFGKRPEDREALSSQANRLIGDFTRDLRDNQPASQDPLPRGGFEI